MTIFNHFRDRAARLTVSNQPLNMTISTNESGFNLTTSEPVTSSVAFFSVSQNSHSLLNATSIPINSTQTASFSVVDWSKLNSSQPSVSLQIFQTNSGTPVATYSLNNGQQGLPSIARPIQSYIVPFSSIAIVVILIAWFYFAKHHKTVPSP